MNKVLALNTEGDITYCTCEPSERGKGRCNHIEHQEENESVENFVARIEIKQQELGFKDANHENYHEITQDEINNLASTIDEIAGEKVTVDNFKSVISKLPPDKIAKIAELSFKAAPQFSLPITDEQYEDANIQNKLYFANLPAYGISGNMASIQQMFDKVGNVPTLDGDVFVEHSYQEGLSPGEYFARQFGARDALINKGVSTAKPGHCIYEDSIVEIKNPDGLGTINIPWHELEIGNEFIDGSIVVEMQPWSKKECFELQLEGFDKIILSHDHLLYGEIIVNGKIIENLEKSEQSRRYVGESDKKWICVEDIFEFFNLGAMISLNGENAKLIYIKKFKSGDPQKVRCISSNTGFYETNGLIHHNTARKLFYSMSDIQVVNDCGGPYIDAMHCNMPEGHVCIKCAHITKGGQNIKVGDLIGGLVSTNMSEALTQLSMKQMHVGSSEVSQQQGNSSIIMGTLDGWGTSPIIQKMREAQTTEEMRQILYDGLNEQYSKANIKQDEFNLQIVARKLTSYKRTTDGLRPINPGEKCDIVSMGTLGNANNIFKVSQLSSGYKHLTKPLKQEIKKDAANQIML